MDVAGLRRISRRQLGLFTRAQARACGYSAKQIRTRIRSGSWLSVAGVLAEPGVTITTRIRDRAAQLAVPGSVLAGPSAARLWGIPVPQTEPCLIVGPDSHRTVRGIRLLRTELDARDLRLSFGIRHTSRARTVFDCLRVLPEARALDLLERALQQRWILLDDLIARVQAFTGRRGAPKLVRLVHDVSTGARSAAERILVGLLVGARIEGWTANTVIFDDQGPVGVGDVVFDDVALIIELDGWAFHVTPEQFQRDRQRQNRLIRAGWTVLRFTWRDLTERPQYVLSTILATLDRLDRRPR
jgi:very-short-patch-repair endonuclease